MGFKVSVSYWMYFYLAFLLLILPVRYFFAWVCAVMIHELGHITAVILLGGKIEALSIRAGAVKIRSTPMQKGSQAIAIAAGPFLGVLPVVFRRWVPELALCSWCLSVYNMMPFSSLDGGNLLELIVGNGKWVERIRLGVWMMLVFCGVLMVCQYSVRWLPIAFIPLLGLGIRKIPCKARRCKVQ